LPLLPLLPVLPLLLSPLFSSSTRLMLRLAMFCNTPLPSLAAVRDMREHTHRQLQLQQL
jgi:hypothetical protein